MEEWQRSQTDRLPTADEVGDVAGVAADET